MMVGKNLSLSAPSPSSDDPASVLASCLCCCFKGEVTLRPRQYKGRQRKGKHFQLHAIQTQSRQMFGKVEHIHAIKS